MPSPWRILLDEEDEIFQPAFLYSTRAWLFYGSSLQTTEQGKATAVRDYLDLGQQVKRRYSSSLL